MRNASMSCLPPIGSNSAFQYGKDLVLVEQNCEGSSDAGSHRRVHSDTSFLTGIDPPQRSGQHDDQTRAQEGVTKVSHGSRGKEVTMSDLGFEIESSIKASKSQSIVIPSDDEQSSPSSSMSLHLPARPRVPLIVPPMPVPSSTDVDKGDCQINNLREIFEVAEKATMAKSEQADDASSPHIGIPQLPLWPATNSSPSLPQLPVSQPEPNVHPITRNHFDKEWIKIQGLRLSIWSLRSKIHESRVTLKLKQLARADAGDKYLQYIRVHNAGGTGNTLQKKGKAEIIISDVQTMDELFHNFQIASDEYGPLEDECNQLEDTLSSQEFELQRLEKKFYDRPLNRFPLDTNEVPRQASNSSAYSGSDIAQEFHPFVTEYLSKVGDVEILKERLEYHEDERFNLEEEKATKRIADWDLASDDQEFLDTFHATKRGLLDELAREQAEAEILRRKCLAQRLIEEDGTPKEFPIREQETFDNETDLEAGSETSEYVKYPLLISEPGGQVSYIDEPRDIQEPSQDSSLMVNNWLFTQLQMTPLEVNLLARTYELQYGHIQEKEKWQRDVLRLWFSDASNNNWQGPLTSSGVVTRAGRNTAHGSYLSSDIVEKGPNDTPIDSVFLGGADEDMVSVDSGDDGTIFGAPRPNPLATPDTPEHQEIRLEEPILRQVMNLDII